MKPTKKIPWAHSSTTKLDLNCSSRKGSPVFQVNLWQVLTEALNPTYSCLNFVLHFLPQISRNSKMVLLCYFQIPVRPNTKHSSGWWNLAVDWKKGGGGEHQNNRTTLRQSTNFSLLFLPRWASSTAVQRQMHTVMFYQFMSFWYMLDHHHALCV